MRSLFALAGMLALAACKSQVYTDDPVDREGNTKARNDVEPTPNRMLPPPAAKRPEEDESDIYAVLHFADVTDAEPSTDVTAVSDRPNSASALSVYCTGARALAPDGSWSRSTLSNPGDPLVIGMTSSPEHGKTITATITVDQAVVQWHVTTK